MRVGILGLDCGKAGFADHLIAQVGFAHGAQEIITFDHGFAEAEKVRRL